MTYRMFIANAMMALMCLTGTTAIADENPLVVELWNGTAPDEIEGSIGDDCDESKLALL